MEVLRAKSAGFCVGVSRALKMLDIALQDENARIVMIGPIIHNNQVIEAYAKKGVVTLNSVDEVLALHATGEQNLRVVIRAHGLPLHEEERLISCGIQRIDATCPRVKDAQLAIAKATANENGLPLPLALFGEADHPEVLGLLSYAKGSCFVFDNCEEAEKIVKNKPASFVLAAQTTQELTQFDAILALFRENVAELKELMTICCATGRRQEEAILLAKQVEAMVIVGGKTSGNTRRLFDVAHSANIAAWHVEHLQELLKETDFLEKKEHFEKLALTAGASTPKDLIDELHDYLLHM